MLRQCLVPHITKKVISYLLVLRQQPFIALQIQNFHWSISTIYLRIIRNFFNSKLFLQKSQKNTNKTQKKPGQVLIRQQIPQLKNIKLFQKNLKSAFFNLCQNSTQTTMLKPNQTRFTGHNQIRYHFFIKKYLNISMTFKIEICQFYD